jgi:hypothetical protein
MLTIGLGMLHNKGDHRWKLDVVTCLTTGFLPDPAFQAEAGCIAMLMQMCFYWKDFIK